MDTLERNQLVWLDDSGWQQIQAESLQSDAQVQDILAHWRSLQWPLVVTRRRCDCSTDQVCLGLPAPQRWDKRKLAMQVRRSAVSLIQPMPDLREINRNQAWQTAGNRLADRLEQAGVRSGVYGSYAWQHITGLSYLHVGSDLDLSLNVRHLAQAALVVALLTQACTQELPRLDGEIVFAGGKAVAWRELQQLLSGQVKHVLIKDIHRVALVNQLDIDSLCETVCA